MHFFARTNRSISGKILHNLNQRTMLFIQWEIINENENAYFPDSAVMMLVYQTLMEITYNYKQLFT